MDKSDIFRELENAIKNFDGKAVEKYSRKAVEAGIDPVETLEEGLTKPLRHIGERFGRGEAFITELIAGAQAMEEGAKILNEEIKRHGKERKQVGEFMIGTVEGDIHSIGKNIVATMLRANGFKVYDLGVDVPTEEFVKAVRKNIPDILGLSALMTTTMDRQREVIDALKKAGLRDEIKIIVGGAPVNQEWVEEIDADACGLDASTAVTNALKLIKKE
jgi:corrinoid protein of di/trimethylamine methyltransferase